MSPHAHTLSLGVPISDGLISSATIAFSQPQKVTWTRCVQTCSAACSPTDKHTFVVVRLYTAKFFVCLICLFLAAWSVVLYCRLQEVVPSTAGYRKWCPVLLATGSGVLYCRLQEVVPSTGGCRKWCPVLPATGSGVMYCWLQEVVSCTAGYRKWCPVLLATGSGVLYWCLQEVVPSTAGYRKWCPVLPAAGNGAQYWWLQEMVSCTAGYRKWCHVLLATGSGAQYCWLQEVVSCTGGYRKWCHVLLVTGKLKGIMYINVHQNLMLSELLGVLGALKGHSATYLLAKISCYAICVNRFPCNPPRL